MSNKWETRYAVLAVEHEKIQKELADLQKIVNLQHNTQKQMQGTQTNMTQVIEQRLSDMNTQNNEYIIEIERLRIELKKYRDD